MVKGPLQHVLLSGIEAASYGFGTFLVQMHGSWYMRTFRTTLCVCYIKEKFPRLNASCDACSLSSRALRPN